jgi:hypothetical protein
MFLRSSLAKLPRHQYEAFDQLNGQHPLQAISNSCVLYPVRQLEQGSVTYFNYQLAKEMGLIPQDHPNSLSEGLETKLLETFNIQIINEFDQERGKVPSAWKIKPHSYMATRYLQLQHKSKKGKTSGDGRSIWNGVVRNSSLVWDVSSRGTGVTRFAPGFVKAQKPLQTGNVEHGYGCGLAELEYLYGSAIQSEIFHNQGLETERVLCIIDHGSGFGIGVRAGQNLLRPAHLFLQLKQDNYKDLRALADYFIERQYSNSRFQIRSNNPKRYKQMTHWFLKKLGEFTGRMEAENIFVWMEWDGDNILMEPGIIDYGSVRQFGLHHATYRYDDVERFSTNLLEQKHKALQIAQTMIQMCVYLQTGNKQPLRNFASHPWLKIFFHAFRAERLNRKLQSCGFSKSQTALLLSQPSMLQRWEAAFAHLESKKRSGPLRKVADGVWSPALLDVRSMLRSLAGQLAHGASPQLEDCLLRMKTPFSTRSFLLRDRQVRRGCAALIKAHLDILRWLEKNSSAGRSVLSQVQQKADVLGRVKPMTGNALIHAIAQISGKKSQNLIDLLINHQSLGHQRRLGPVLVQDSQAWQNILDILHDHRFSI